MRSFYPSTTANPPKSSVRPVKSGSQLRSENSHFKTIFGFTFPLSLLSKMSYNCPTIQRESILTLGRQKPRDETKSHLPRCPKSFLRSGWKVSVVGPLPHRYDADHSFIDGHLEPRDRRLHFRFCSYCRSLIRYMASVARGRLQRKGRRLILYARGIGSDIPPQESWHTPECL